jgi:hypothetical protein
VLNHILWKAGVERRLLGDTMGSESRVQVGFGCHSSCLDSNAIARLLIREDRSDG